MTTKRQKITTKFAELRAALDHSDERAGVAVALTLAEMAMHDLCRIADSLEQVALNKGGTVSTIAEDYDA